MTGSWVQSIGATDDAGFIETCGTCGTEWRLVNLVRTPRPSPESVTYVSAKTRARPDHGTGCPDCTERSAVAIEGELMCRQLGWCGCGTPGAIDDAMRDYLGQDRPPPMENILSVEAGLVAEIMAYIADHQGWTEHGGTVRGAWLTDTGRTALAALVADHERNPDA